MSVSARILAELRRHRIAVPLFLLAIVAMVILPLPATVLDVLFTFNIVLALIVILVSVTNRRPLDFSVFPTVILASTLMRLTLNVASTRIVLLNGHEGTHAAGRVIEAFGHVAIGSNVVVGIVVFAILTIINFVVVTKGAERISEVSARFTLDALPGKQMAIDADLNAGLINQEKAQLRRREVSSEADFYGAMDGASKFVRGDAIAGILILFINMIGGVAIGSLMHDLSLADSFRLYALLTIGDGLVAQIPALLLSAAAAIIVTRISDSGNFEEQVGSQMLASPSVLYGAAGMMLVLGIIPGMPWLTFLAFAAVLAFAAWRMSREAEAERDQTQTKAALLSAREPELDWRSLPFVEPLSVSVGYKLAALLDQTRDAPLVKRVKGVRQNISESMGVLLPQIALRDDLSLRPTQYAVLLRGTIIAQAEVYPDRLMAIASAQVYGWDSRQRPRVRHAGDVDRARGTGQCPWPGLPGSRLRQRHSNSCLEGRARAIAGIVPARGGTGAARAPGGSGAQTGRRIGESPHTQSVVESLPPIAGRECVAQGYRAAGDNPGGDR
jgi:flagellar biosynthesis protein FlhA